MSIMAIDYGDAHTGIAISDASATIPGHCETLVFRKTKPLIQAISALITQYQVDTLVLGFPKNMDGSDGKRADLYRKFAQALEEETTLAPILWDERSSTVEAHHILSSVGKKRINHKKTVDAVAASLLLEGYLSFRKLQQSQ